MGQLILDSEAAEILRMTTRQVVSLARRGDLPSIRFPNGEIRFDPTDLQRWVESLKQPATAEATR